MLNIYAIKDTKAGFMNPFYLQNDEVAFRSFKSAANDTQKNAVNDYSEDKELYYLGTFDERNGTVTGEEPRFIARAIDLVTKKAE